MSWSPEDALSPHFRVRELDPENAAEGEERERLRELAQVLEAIRAELGGRPVAVTRSGGYQPPDDKQSRRWPSRKPTSQHRRARAADIVVRGVSALDVANTVGRMVREGRLEQVGGVGCYVGDGFVHVDTRPRTKGGRLALWAQGCKVHRREVRWEVAS